MKYKLLFIFLIAISENLFAQPKNDLLKSNLNGKVKSVTQQTFGIKRGTNESDLSKSLQVVSIYNKNGNLAEIFIYSPKKTDSVASHRKYNYDKNGYVVSIRDKNGKQIRKSQYSYNDKKNLIEETSSSERISSRIVYNGHKKRDTMYSYSRDGKLNRKAIYSYDSKGNCIQEKIYKSEGNLDRVENYVYYSKNRKIQENHYDSTQTKTGTTSFKYDDYGNVLLRIDSNQMFIGGLPRKK